MARGRRKQPPLKVVISKDIQISGGPKALHAELVERLKFVNPKWIENERLGRWNRNTPKILRYYSRKRGNGLAIPRGFMRQLILMSRRYDVAVQLDDRRRKLPDIDLHFGGELKSFQLQAAKIMLAKDFGTLSAPTGSGKTIITLYMMAQRRQPTLIVVHTKELAFQWIDRIRTFLDVDESDIGLIGGGKLRLGPKITVALVQSLYKCASEVSRNFGFLVVDECHRAPSRTFTEAVSEFDTQYMLGLSATPWRRDRLSKLIFWHLGDLHHEVNKSDLVANGHILDMEIILRPTEFKPYYDPVNEYSKMLSELTSNDARNRLIAKDVAAEIQQGPGHGICLVLSDRKQHCQTLQALLKHKYHVHAEVMTGDLPLELRRSVVERLEDGQVQVLIATGQLVGEGFDCPGLSTLFLTTPIRFSGRLVQYLGRILRPAKGIERARVFDYVDIHVGPLMAAAQARQRLYRT